MCYQSHQSSPSSELIELPEVFSSMEKCLLHQALRPLGALEPSRPLRALLALTQHFLMYSLTLRTRCEESASRMSHPSPNPPTGNDFISAPISCEGASPLISTSHLCWVQSP